MSRLAAAVVAVVVPTIVNLAIVARGYDGGPYLRGDCLYYYATAVSLWHDRDLDLRNQIPRGALSNNVALSTDGRIVPKHSILLPILSAPLIAALGTPGALVFNLMQFAVLLWLMFELALEAAPRGWIATAAVLLTYAASGLPHYAWNYSPDLLAATLLAGATIATMRAESRASFFRAGALLGLSVVAKYPLVLCVPGAVFLVRRVARSEVGAFAFGLLLPLIGLAWLNTHLFGAPWITGYDRILTLQSGRVIATYSQRASFTEPLVTGMVGQLVDRQHGLLTTSPVTLVAIVGLVSLTRTRPRLAMYVGTASLLLFVFYSTYREWPASSYGNRFLMPVVALFVAPLAALLQTIASELRRVRPREDAARTSPPDPTAA